MTTEQNNGPNDIDLKTVREQLGLTLQDIYERTRISIFNLEAIEKGNFHLIPAPLYARNFIKTYAAALGVDGKPLLQRYENYLQATQTKVNEQIPAKTQNESIGMVMNRYKVYLWIAAIIMVIAAVSLFISVSNKSDTEVLPAPEARQKSTAPSAQPPIVVYPENQPVMEFPKQPDNMLMPNPSSPQTLSAQKPEETKLPEAKQDVPEAEPSAAPAGENDAKKITELIDKEEASVMIIRASEETWARIQTDDKEPFQILLKPGERSSYKGARFNIDIGNAAGVKIDFKGKTFENLGKTGQVIHLRLP